MNSQEYYLNIRPGDGYPQTVKVSQGDVGRPLLFHLMDGVNPLSIPAGATITIHGTKPSGLGFTETCTVSGSSAAISTTLDITQEYGLFPAELVVSANDDIIATANFSLFVERSPHPDGTTDGTKEELDDLYTEVANLKEDIENISGISDDVKTALLQIAQKVAYIDDDGQDYYDALYNALYPPAEVVSISAVYTQSGTVYDTDTLDSLKADLVVTATYDDSTTAEVTSYTLSGTLTEGTSTITVSYGGKTTTFTVTVTADNRPLYSLDDIAYHAVTADISLGLSDGNHFAVKTTSNSRTVLVYSDGTSSNSSQSGKPTIFTLSANDEIEIKIKNISYTNSTAADNYFYASVFRNGGDAALYSAGKVMLGSGTGTVQDATLTSTVTANENVGGIKITVYRAVELTFDYEIYVNGVLYIGASV